MVMELPLVLEQALLVPVQRLLRVQTRMVTGTGRVMTGMMTWDGPLPAPLPLLPQQPRHSAPLPLHSPLLLAALEASVARPLLVPVEQAPLALAAVLCPTAALTSTSRPSTTAPCLQWTQPTSQPMCPYPLALALAWVLPVAWAWSLLRLLHVRPLLPAPRILRTVALQPVHPLAWAASPSPPAQLSRRPRL